MDNIKLHPKYGLNPAMGICFWCGQEDGTLILLGASSKEERRHVCSTLKPCADCKEMSKTDEYVYLAVIDSNNQPTGQRISLRRTAVRAWIDAKLMPETFERLLEMGFGACDEDFATMLKSKCEEADHA